MEVPKEIRKLVSVLEDFKAEVRQGFSKKITHPTSLEIRKTKTIRPRSTLRVGFLYRLLDELDFEWFISFGDGVDLVRLNTISRSFDAGIPRSSNIVRIFVRV